MLQPFITPLHTLHNYLRQTISGSHKLKMKLKGLHFADVAEIEEAVTDELKKVQKEEFLAVFRKCTTAQKDIYIQGVPGGMDNTSGECSLCQTIPI